MSDVLRDVIARNRAGLAVALPSICSVHPDVLKAALISSAELSHPVAIEATANQVNQEGGYTGMTPGGFADFLFGIADEVEADMETVVLGGDHLGPLPWCREPVGEAMAKARILVADYARAGFTKIHIDCSAGLSGESARLDDGLIATRSVDLVRICLEVAPAPERLLFVIGTEVPSPGGARVDAHGNVPATTSDAARVTLAAHQAAFEAAGIGAAWGQVGALVAQPGVEFTPTQVHHLPVGLGSEFRSELANWPGICLEAHSTDYQDPEAYRRLAEMGFAIQKVGPALTFAWREALYGLDTICRLAGWGADEGIPEVMERLMLSTPSHWCAYCEGDASDQRLLRHFGLADRIRYYWWRPEARTAVKGLLDALSARTLHEPLLRQCFARPAIERARTLLPRFGSLPHALLGAAVQIALDPYFVNRSGIGSQSSG